MLTVLLVALYVLSIGPAYQITIPALIRTKTQPDTPANVLRIHQRAQQVEAFYAPLYWLGSKSPTFRNALDRYTDLWLRKT